MSATLYNSDICEYTQADTNRCSFFIIMYQKKNIIIAFFLMLAPVGVTAQYQKAQEKAPLVNVPLENFASQQKVLFNFGWKFQLVTNENKNTDFASPALDDTTWRTMDLQHDFQYEQPWKENGGGKHGFKHMCEGWLEGYLLTGRHGFFASYEAFIRVVDSMAAQHAKWLKVCNQLSWRQPIASLNFILTSNVWQQDHNGFTHQDPGFLDHIANKKADVVRMYLPPDTNCLLSCFDHCIKSKNYVNAIVASKHPSYQWLSMEQAVKHCTQGVGIWEWASNDCGEEPDLVMACCGDTPTLETMAAVTILRDELPELKIRVVNVVDLFKLESNHKHPHGLSDSEYNALFTTDKPVIFAFHGYPTLIHELTYRRDNQNVSVHGYQEEGTITTPFDMRVQNEIDRFNLVKDAIMHLPQLGNKGSFLIQKMNDKLVEHKQYIAEYGQDLEEIRNWEWHK